MPRQKQTSKRDRDSISAVCEAGFAPIDSEGFRSFSLHGVDGAEVIRVSVHIERFREGLPSIIEDFEHPFVPAEGDALRTAAEISSARKLRTIGSRKIVVPEMDAKTALKALLARLPDVAAEEVEKHFPFLASEFLEVASDVCAKRAVNRLVHSQVAQMVGNPRPRKLPLTIYDESFVDSLVEPLKDLIKGYLMIQPGRNPETLQHIQKTRRALRRLDEEGLLIQGKAPNPEDIASQLNESETIDVGTVRRWPGNIDMTWDEWLYFCGWNRQGDTNTN